MKHFIIVFILISFIRFSYEAASQKSDYETRWAKWKRITNKRYTDDREEQFRKQILFRKFRLVDKFKKLFSNGKISFIVDVYELSDIPYSDYLRVRTGLKVPSHIREQLVMTPLFHKKIKKNSNEKDQEFNWKNFKMVTSVKNQGQCSGSFAFAVLAAMESQYLKKKIQVDLSEQQLLECYIGAEGCIEGAWPYEVMTTFLKTTGVTIEKVYPFIYWTNRCRKDKSWKYYKVKNITNFNLNGNEEKLKEVVEKYGPTVVTIHVSKKFEMYRYGIFSDPDCMRPPNHAALVVGYGTRKGVPYWIVKNSWGGHWGEGGYIRIARNSNNMCGIANFGAVPFVE